MSALRITAKDARRLGAVVPKGISDDIKLPSLPGPAGLDRRTEHEFQTAAVAHFRRMLIQPSDVIAIPNQRFMAHLTPKHRASILRMLLREGMRIGALDTLAEWDAQQGAPGNLGACWVECKRAVDPEPLKHEQLQFVLSRRAMGRVAGWAQCDEHFEDLLVEAGAPLLARLPWRDVPPWWAILGEHPPLYGNFGDRVRLPGGGFLRLGPAEARRGASPQMERGPSAPTLNPPGSGYNSFNDQSTD